MAGGSQIIINKNGITIITPAKFEAKAGQHTFKQGAEVGVNLQGLPAYEMYNEKFQMLLPSGEPIPKIDYKISNGNDEFISQTDQKGKSKRIHSPQEENLKFDVNWINLEVTSSENEGDSE
ncbi:hypothetical protein [Acinetobacter sp.]|jgi:type VI secretion system secreted protein VgrG|uniref:hypothetical protein n=1 Tax=Acinetobacter sp. TaxID=472 RepID=UPI002827170E|nr:hypothetical protein [Acinetobacter sp.]MDR0234831.1 hypothetical protein [Acinetobacter sp.]